MLPKNVQERIEQADKLKNAASEIVSLLAKKGFTVSEAKIVLNAAEYLLLESKVSLQD